MAKEMLDIANLIYFFTIPRSLEAWLCEKHLRSYLRSFRSYFTHPAAQHVRCTTLHAHAAAAAATTLQRIDAIADGWCRDAGRVGVEVGY
jgi:hypothetical protein